MFDLCFSMHYFLAIILTMKKELVVLLLLSSIYVLWLFLMVPWVGLQCVIKVFPDHTHFFKRLFE